jgi:hypothetical protein
MKDMEMCSSQLPCNGGVWVSSRSHVNRKASKGGSLPKRDNERQAELTNEGLGMRVGKEESNVERRKK